MRHLWFSLILAGAATVGCCAESLDLRLREVGSVARTNTRAALVLCDKVTADFPSNAAPWLARARLLDTERKYSEALQSIESARKLEPQSARVFQARGEVNFKSGRFKESAADFDRVLELYPEQAAHHWQRGISLYYAGKFAEGRKQFELHKSVNPNDVENAAWHFLCAARESGVTNARNNILPVGKDGRSPMPEIYELYRGTGNVDQVITAATRAAKNPNQENALFYAHLYLGLYYEIIGNITKARQHITRAAKDPVGNHYMGDVARAHLFTLPSAP